AAPGFDRIDYGDTCSSVRQAHGEIAADEAEAARDDDLLVMELRKHPRLRPFCRVSQLAFLLAKIDHFHAKTFDPPGNLRGSSLDGFCLLRRRKRHLQACPLV